MITSPALAVGAGGLLPPEQLGAGSAGASWRDYSSLLPAADKIEIKPVQASTQEKQVVKSNEPLDPKKYALTG